MRDDGSGRLLGHGYTTIADGVHQRQQCDEPGFSGQRQVLRVNVLNHEQELMARHFAGMTGMAMEGVQPLMLAKGPLAQPVLKGSLASL